MPVPFGFSVADFLTLGQLAFRVYRSYQDAPSSFAELSDDIKILHVHLQEVADRIAEPDRRILPSQHIAMQEVAGSCQVTLVRLEGIMSQYSVMDMQKQLTWERLRWQVEDQMQIKQDITVKLLAVNNLNQSLSGSSMTKLMLNLQRLVTQAMATRSHGTIVSAITNTDMGSDHLWQSIGRDFQVAGISREMVLTNRDVIREHIQQIFSSGLIATDESDTDSAWDSRSLGRSGSTSSFSPGVSAASTVYESPEGARSATDTSYGFLKAYQGPQEKKNTQTRRNEPQCPWEKLTDDSPPLTNEDATYRPFVVEVKLVTPELPKSTHSQSGFSFKSNRVSEHSWVFRRLSQHTREGFQPLYTPDPYNPVEDHGRQSAAKWTESAFSQALRDWKHFLLPSDQPLYVCMPSSQEGVFKTLAKDHPFAYPIIFSFDIDSGAISFWKLLGRRWAGRSSYQYHEKSMEAVPSKGLLQFVKRISLRQQAKAFNLEGVRGRGQMLLMLFTQKAIDQTKSFAQTWIFEQKLSEKPLDHIIQRHRIDRPDGLSSQLDASPQQPPTIQIPAGQMPSAAHSLSAAYLAKATALCGYEGSGQDELSFVIGDEIWVTEYIHVEIWQGINQRTQENGVFPKSLVRPTTIRKMPSSDKLPHEIGSSALSFAANDGLLSPHQPTSKHSLQNRTQRSASTGALPSQASGPVYHELDSTEISSNPRLSTHSDSGLPSSDRQLSRGKTTASDRGPGRASEDYPGGTAYSPYAYQQLLAESSISRSQSQRAWTPPSRNSVVSPLPFPSHVGSPYPSGISPAPSLLVSPYMSPAPPSIPTGHYFTPRNMAMVSKGGSPVLTRQYDRFDFQDPGSALLPLEATSSQSAEAGPKNPRLPPLSTFPLPRGELSSPITAPPDFRAGTGWGSTNSFDVPIPSLRAQVSAFLERQARDEENMTEAEIASHPNSHVLNTPIKTHDNVSGELPKKSGGSALLAQKSPTRQPASPPKVPSLLDTDTPSLLDTDTPLISTEVEQRIFNLSVKAGEARD